MTFLTVTSTAWYMAGICICVVFAILVILKWVLNIFGFVAKQGCTCSTSFGSRQACRCC